MDSILGRYAARVDGDLMICEEIGVAYQRDLTSNRIEYDAVYLAKVDAYDGTPIAQAVNAGRIAMLGRRLKPGAKVLDVGAGSGAFVRDARAAGYDAKGYEVIPLAADRLRASGAFLDDPAGMDAVTFWDSLEHMADPAAWLRRLDNGVKVFASIPVFPDLRRIRESKHYRPGEHFTYWTQRGFTRWVALYGFFLIEYSNHEVDAGRESIGAFAFQRVAA